MVDLQAFSYCRYGQPVVESKITRSYGTMLEEHMLASAGKYANELRVGPIDLAAFGIRELDIYKRFCLPNKRKLSLLKMSKYRSHTLHLFLRRLPTNYPALECLKIALAQSLWDPLPSCNIIKDSAHYLASGNEG